MFILIYALILAFGIATASRFLHHNILMYAPLMAYMPLLTTSCDKFIIVFLSFSHIAVFILIYALMLAFGIATASRFFHHNILMYVPLMTYMPLHTTSCDKFNIVFIPFSM